MSVVVVSACVVIGAVVGGAQEAQHVADTDGVLQLFGPLIIISAQVHPLPNITPFLLPYKQLSNLNKENV